MITPSAKSQRRLIGATCLSTAVLRTLKMDILHLIIVMASAATVPPVPAADSCDVALGSFG